jgi:site-specific DNA recombinase
VHVRLSGRYLQRRRCVHTSESGKKRSFSSNHCFAQIVVCGKCGEIFRRVHWNNRGKKSIVWRCVSRLENTGLFCDARTVPESTLEQVTVAAINEVLGGKDDFLAILEKNIAAVLSEGNDETLADIDNRLEDLQTQLLKLASSKADYENVAEEIYRLREQKQKAQVENAGRDELRKRNADMSAFLQEQSTAVGEFNELLVRRLIEKVIVYENSFTVKFKSGVTMEKR